jgi:hypothetical protein
MSPYALVERGSTGVLLVLKVAELSSARTAEDSWALAPTLFLWFPLHCLYGVGSARGAQHRWF